MLETCSFFLVLFLWPEDYTGLVGVQDKNAGVNKGIKLSLKG